MTIGTFSENKIDYSLEYLTLREKMGTKGYDLDKVMKATLMLYINCDDESWNKMLFALIKEIEMRQAMLFSIKLRKLVQQ